MWRVLNRLESISLLKLSCAVFSTFFCVVLVQPIKGWVESFWKKNRHKIRTIGSKDKGCGDRGFDLWKQFIGESIFQKVSATLKCPHALGMQPTRPKKTGWQKTDPGRLSPATLFFERQLRPETRNYSEMVGSDSWWLRKGCEDLRGKTRKLMLKSYSIYFVQGLRILTQKLTRKSCHLLCAGVFFGELITVAPHLIESGFVSLFIFVRRAPIVFSYEP